MSGGMKGGSKPSGFTTSTMQNPTQTAQLPFLTGGAGSMSPSGNQNVGWNQAYNLATENPYQYYPGQTLATPNYWQPTGYNDLAAAGANANALLPQGNSIFGSLAGGSAGVENSPAYAELLALANGTSQSTQDLSKVASGGYIVSNPYLDDMFGHASDAVTRAYMTATAPGTSGNFSAAGRYGSGAMANAMSQNQQDLGRSLGGLSASIYGGDYEAERGRMDAAARALAAIQGSAGSTLQSGFQAGNNNLLQALSLFPSLLSAQGIGAGMEAQAGEKLTGLEQNVIDDAMKRFYGEIEMPWKTNASYLTQIGQPTTGSGQATQPYFQNGMASLLSGATGGLGLYNGLNSAFGGKGGSSGVGFGADYGGGGELGVATGLMNGGWSGGGFNPLSLLPFGLGSIFGL